MNRDTAIFGVDADEFRPERWMDNPEKARHMDSMLTTVCPWRSLVVDLVVWIWV